MLYIIRKNSDDSYNLIEFDTKTTLLYNCKTKKECKRFLTNYALIHCF